MGENGENIYENAINDAKVKTKGRPKNIKSPAKMWELFEDYRKEIKENPFYLVEQRKGNIIVPRGREDAAPAEIKDTVKLPLMRPLTMEGFQNYLENQGVITDVTDYFENKEGRYSDFIRIVARIRREIRQDQIEGGMANIYNPSITARLNGLTEKVQQEVTNKDFEITLNLNK